MHGLVFETSVYYWQDQPGCYSLQSRRTAQVYLNVNSHCLITCNQLGSGVQGWRRDLLRSLSASNRFADLVLPKRTLWGELGSARSRHSVTRYTRVQWSLFPLMRDSLRPLLTRRRHCHKDSSEEANDSFYQIINYFHTYISHAQPVLDSA